MKFTHFLLPVLLAANFCNAQVKTDLFLFYNDTADILLTKSENDSVYMETYTIRSNKNCGINTILDVDKNGNLTKQIQITKTDSRIVRFTYRNDGRNNPILVNEKNIINNLSLNDLLYKIDLDEFYRIVSRFENLYLVVNKSYDSSFYIAKKINVEKEISKF